MNCYICLNKNFTEVEGAVRDKPELKILKCTNCGLITLENFFHINDDFYKTSQMSDWDNIEEYANSCIENDLWRVNKYKKLFRNKIILDFGCGLGGFIKEMLKYTRIFGIDLDPIWRYVNSEITQWMYEDINEIPDNYFDYITLFHVLEHLKDPRKTLKTIIPKLKENGTFIIEVPNADDALLTLYECEAFQNFTYWSCHLFLFNQYNLKLMLEQIGLKIPFIIQTQRYPLSNHLYWLAKGKPNGHKIWNFIDNPEYEKHLAKLGKCDTLVAYGKK